MGLVVSAIRQLAVESRKWTWHHACAFLITYFLYAMYHACRKAFSNIKDLMAKSFSPYNNTLMPYDTWQQRHMFESPSDANVFFGELDLLFLLAYSIGLYISGMFGDRVNLRHMLSAGVVGSSLLTFLFGYLSVPLNIHNKMYYRVLFFANGLCQSTGWPALVAVVGNWFSKSSSGLVFGLWSTNSNMGNMIGSFFVAMVIDHGYEYGMLLNSMFSFCGGLITFFCLIPHPNQIGLPSCESHSNTTTTNDISKEASELHENGASLEIPTRTSLTYAYELQIKPPDENKEPGKERNDVIEPISFWQACLIPGVIPYAFSYACLKMVTYAFFFWLPVYLTQGLQWTDATSDKLSNFYDVGGIIGSFLSGVLSDFVGYRSPVVSCMLFLSIGSVYLYSTPLGANYIANVVLMVVSGCMLVGPASLICTAICSDLGKNEKLAGNTQALATVSGIVDGTGSFGAAIGQYLVGIVSKYFGWHWVFNFLLIMLSVSFTLVIPMVVSDFKTYRRRRRQTSVGTMN